MVIYAPLSFTQEITRTQTKSRLSVGSLGSRLRGSQVDGNLLSQIAKMADTDRLPIVLCWLSMLRFIEMAKKNQQCVGPLKWESGAKVTRCCLILFFELEKDLVSQISVAS